MNFQDLFVGALSLNSKAFEALRERSDVFWRGFLVLLFAGIFAGVFGALPEAISHVTPLATKDEVIQIARGQFENNYSGPADLKPVYEEYVDNIASAIYEVLSLPPRAGEGARAVTAVLDWVGNVLATPFTSRWIGGILFLGLLFQLIARWLGGRASMAQMLGMTALATAPQIFWSLTSVLTLISNVSNIAAFGAVVPALNFVIMLWTAVIYVKAMAVAQKFTIWRSIGTVVLGGVVLIAAFIVFFIVLGAAVAALVVVTATVPK